MRCGWAGYPSAYLHLRLGPANPLEDIAERGAGVASRPPAVHRRQAPVVGQINAHVGGARFSHRRDM